MSAGTAPHLKAVGSEADERALQTLADHAGERLEPEDEVPSGPPPGLTPASGRLVSHAHTRPDKMKVVPASPGSESLPRNGAPCL